MRVFSVSRLIVNAFDALRIPGSVVSRVRSLGRRLWSWMQSSQGIAWSAVVLACVGSRLATTITYIEDPDSLRFALSVAEGYDVAALQPHFPGYPVFWVVAKAFFLATGRFSVSFSLVGAGATVGLMWATLRLWDVRLRSLTGAVLAGLVFFSPLVWLMGNRYMPDLLGTAVVLGGLVLLLRGLGVTPARGGSEAFKQRSAFVGMAVVGLLAGLRLSYLPMVLLPLVGLLWYRPDRLQLLGVAAVSVLVWLVPLVADTGASELIDVAWGQTTGHFTDFGGTVQTEPNVLRRVSGFVEGLWADGLGAWWPGRHPLTIVTGLGVLVGGAFGVRRLRRMRGKWGRRLFWVGACAGVYALWVFFFQNVVHKSRHVLPLVPVVLGLLAFGVPPLWQRSWWIRVLAVAAGASYVVVALVLVVQHQGPTAIAQVKDFVDDQSRQRPVRVASVPLVNENLHAQAVDAEFLSIEDSTDVQRLERPETFAGRTLIIGRYPSVQPSSPDTVRTFYHNPYVNRMWPEVTVSVYD